jgi:hypothetical protein
MQYKFFIGYDSFDLGLHWAEGTTYVTLYTRVFFLVLIHILYPLQGTVNNAARIL